MNIINLIKLFITYTIICIIIFVIYVYDRYTNTFAYIISKRDVYTIRMLGECPTIVSIIYYNVNLGKMLFIFMFSLL